MESKYQNENMSPQPPMESKYQNENISPQPPMESKYQNQPSPQTINMVVIDVDENMSPEFENHTISYHIDDINENNAILKVNNTFKDWNEVDVIVNQHARQNGFVAIKSRKDLDEIVQRIRPSMASLPCPSSADLVLIFSGKGRAFWEFCEYVYDRKLRYRLLCHGCKLHVLRTPTIRSARSIASRIRRTRYLSHNRFANSRF